MVKVVGKQNRIFAQHKANSSVHTFNCVRMELDLHLLVHKTSLEINGFQYSHKQMATNGFKPEHVMVVNVIHCRHIMEVQDIGWKVQHLVCIKYGIFVVTSQTIAKINQDLQTDMGMVVKIMLNMDGVKMELLLLDKNGLEECALNFQRTAVVLVTAT